MLSIITGSEFSRISRYLPGVVRSVNSSITMQSGKQPHSVPESCWDVVSMDVSDFATSRTEKGSVLVVVDRISKRAIFIPMKKT